MSATPLLWASLLATVGEQLGQDGEAEGKETWLMSYLPSRSYGTGHVARMSSGAACQREAGERPFPHGALSVDSHCCFQAPLEAPAFVGKAWQDSAKHAAADGEGLLGDCSPSRPAGTRGRLSTPTDELPHLFIFIRPVAFQNYVDRRPFGGYFIT